MAAALVAAPLVSGAIAPAFAADSPAPIVNSTFDDGSLGAWVPNGGAKLSVVDDPDGTGKALEATNITQGYEGAALDLFPLLTAGVTYDVSYELRLADADQPAGTEHFTSDDGSYSWVGSPTALTADTWTTFTTTYTLPAGATKAKLYLDSTGAAPFPNVLIDNVVITPKTAPPADGGTCTPSPATNVVSENFDGSSLGALINNGSSNVTFEKVDGNVAARVNGRAADYDGIQTAPGALANLTPGKDITVSAKVRLAGDTASTAAARLVFVPGYKWLGNTSTVSSTGWTTISGTYTVPADISDDDLATAKVYVGTDALADGTATYDYYVDDVQIATAAVTCDTPTDPCAPYPTSDTIISSDFESGDLDGWTPRDDGKGVATLAVADGGHSSDHALSVTNRKSQGQGVGHDITCKLEPGVTYQFTGWVRFAAGQPTDDVWLSLANTVGGSTSYSTLGQFTGITNTGWTQVSQKFTAVQGDSQLLYLETKYSSGQTGNTSDLLLDDLQLVKPAASTVQDLTPIKDTVPFPVGAAVTQKQLLGGAGQLLDKHFNQVTSENYMKPEAWYNADHSFVTTNPEADALMDYAQANDIRVYGHTLAWYQQTPDWFFQHDDGTWLTNSDADKQILRDRLKTHVDNVAKYLSDGWGKFGSSTNPLVSFDVVNEVVSDNAGDPEGLRQSHWYQVLGNEYIADAFNDADAAFNHTYAASGTDRPIKLFINDYNTEQTGKRGRLLDLVNSLIAQDVPVDGVGHQLHVTMATDTANIKAALDAFTGIQTATGHQLYQAVTELDVPTGTPVTAANEIDQAYYYKTVFDLLRAQQTAHEDIFSVTVWGLLDGQSWRASSGAPLLFDDDLQAKPAYYGVTDQDLPARQLSAIVFQQGDADVTAATKGATTDVEWSKLPLKKVGDQAGFQLRWSADHLTAFVSSDDTTVDATDAATFTYGAGLTATVKRDGTTTGGVTAQVTSTAAGWKAVVELPVAGLTSGGTTQFDVQVTDGTTTSGWNTPGSTGSLQLVEPLSYTEIPEATVAPTIDGTVDPVWTEGSTVTTSKLLSGAADGSTAVVHQLWKGNYLYVLADVTDATPDSTSPNAYERDSVEIFTDPGNAKNGSYRPDDSQIRIGANGDVSFGAGDEAAQTARLTKAVATTDHGFVVEARLDLLDGNTGVGTFNGVDYEVNDGTDGARTSNHGWAEQTGTAYQTTARWGVAQLVAAKPAAVAPKVTGQPTSATVALGAKATFTAKASGNPAPSVVWQSKAKGSSSWKTVSGATGTSLTVTAAAANDGTSYRAVFTNAAGTATSSAATLTVKTAKPVVTTQPKSVTATLNHTVTFTAKASGYPAPSVVWQISGDGRAWLTLLDERGTSLKVPAYAELDGLRVRAVFTNKAGQTASSTAKLTITRTKPVVTTQPKSVSATLGKTVKLTAKASGYPTPTVTWQRQLKGSSRWTTVSHASTLSVKVSTGVNGAKYRAVFTNRVGSATTHTATVTLKKAKPVITSKPRSMTARAGGVATFRVSAQGYPAVHYQWYVQDFRSSRWVRVTGGQKNAITVSATRGRSGIKFKVVVSSSAGSVTSPTVTLTVR